MPHLFDSFQSRDLTLPNRVVVSPMCQYSSDNGFANDWHLVHLGSRASGGAGLIVYNRKEGRALGEVVKFLVYNARKRSAGGDSAAAYFERTECVAGVTDRLTVSPMASWKPSCAPASNMKG